MDKKFKQALLLVALGAALFAAFMNFSRVLTFLKAAAAMLAPIFTGLLLAFVLNVPMKGFVRLLTRIFPKGKPRVIEVVSLLLTILCLPAVLALVGVLVVPQLAASIRSIIELVKANWPAWAVELRRFGLDPKVITDYFSKFDVQSILDQLLTGAGSLIGSIVTAATSTVTGVINAVFSAVIMFYTLLGKHELLAQAKHLLYAYCKKTTADRLCHAAALTQQTFSKFLSGQCIEVIILGVMIFLAFTVFGIPYAGLTAALTAVCAFVPYVGALISCAVGMLLTALVDPSQVIWCFVIYEVTQFVEGQFIYPHVVGSSVGLSAFWTLLAALLGGKLFGLAGIVFFIPLTAVISQLLHDSADRRLAAQTAAGQAGESAPQGDDAEQRRSPPA